MCGIIDDVVDFVGDVGGEIFDAVDDVGNFLDDIKDPLLDIASVIPSPIQPFAAGINAVNNVADGDIFGGIKSAFGASGLDFGGLGDLFGGFPEFDPTAFEGFLDGATFDGGELGLGDLFGGAGALGGLTTGGNAGQGLSLPGSGTATGLGLRIPDLSGPPINPEDGFFGLRIPTSISGLGGLGGLFGGIGSTLAGLGGNAGSLLGGAGSLLGGLANGAGNALGGLGNLGGLLTQGSLLNSLIRGGLGVYDFTQRDNLADALQQRYDQQQRYIDNYYSVGSPEFEYLKQTLERADSKAGRNSQIGPRTTELLARTAKERGSLASNLANSQAQLLLGAQNALASRPASLAALFGQASVPTFTPPTGLPTGNNGLTNTNNPYSLVG